jgi:hypothetical protein
VVLRDKAGVLYRFQYDRAEKVLWREEGGKRAFWKPDSALARRIEDAIHSAAVRRAEIPAGFFNKIGS